MEKQMDAIFGSFRDESVSNATLHGAHLMESFLNLIQFGKRIAETSMEGHAEWMDSVEYVMANLNEDLAKYGPFLRHEHFRNAEGYLYTYFRCDDSHEYFYTESCAWLIDKLFDVIDEASPDGYVFSAHPGNASDFGFWPIEMMEEL